MSLDTPQSIADRVKLRTGINDRLAQDMVRNAFRDLFERRRWSWLMKPGQIVAPALYSTGKATLTPGSNIVTGTGTTWTPSMVGQQFRLGLGTPIYDIIGYNSPTSLTLGLPWAVGTYTQVGYQIYQCFFPVPSDFHAFYVVIDPLYNWQLITDIGQDIIDIWDAQRANIGQSYVTSFRDYTASYNGTILQPITIAGSHNPCLIAGDASYTGITNSIYTIYISTGGTTGTMQFQWKQDTNAYSSATPTTSGAEYYLSNGMAIYFDPTISYSIGDTFIIQVQTVSNPGVPRYEFWPHQQAAYVYQYLYESRPADVFDPGFVIPRFIANTNIMFEMAMQQTAMWPGTSDQPNVYFNLQLAQGHGAKVERLMGDLERQDEEVFMQDVRYSGWISYPFSPFADSNWIASHAL